MQPLNLFKKSAALFLALALLTAPWTATAYEAAAVTDSVTMNDYERDQELGAARMAADTLLARPLGVVATALGFGLFVVSIPFSALGGNTPEAWHLLVARPAQFTFVRPLGAFH